MPSLNHWPGVLVRAGKGAVADEVPMLASALAFSAFLAIPATLLLVVGVFSLVAEPSLISDLMEKFGTVVPAEAVTLVEDSLLQLEQQPSAGFAMTVVGFVLALWTTTGAMTTFMTAVNRAHGTEDARGFARKRIVALLLVGVVGSAMLLVGTLLVFGPLIQRWVGDALDAGGLVAWIWWTAEWPILLVVLLGAFSAAFALARADATRRLRALSPGAAVATVLWLVVSAAFGLFAANFGSYNKTWGSLSAAIVTLVWLWLSGLALLFGAEVDAEAERAAAGDEHLDVSETVERTHASPLRPAG